MSVCVIISYGKDNVDKATIGLTLANAAISQREEVQIILTSEGVRLGIDDYIENLDNGEPFKPIPALIAEFLQQGGILNVCTPCMAKRGIPETDILEHPNRRFIAGADVIRIVRETDRSIQL